MNLCKKKKFFFYMWLVEVRIMEEFKHIRKSGNYEKKENCELVTKNTGLQIWVNINRGDLNSSFQTLIGF